MSGKSVTYSKETADAICSRMAGGIPLKQVCEADDMPAMETVRRWVRDDVNDFAREFHAADRLKYITMEDECMEIADDSSNDFMQRENKNGEVVDVVNTEHISRSKLRIETRKGFMEARVPDLYGKRQTLEHTGAGGGPIQVREMSQLERCRRILWIQENAKDEAEDAQLIENAAVGSAELPAPPTADA